MSTLDAPLLAGQPGIQRVPKRDLELFIRRHFLTREECAELVARIDAESRPSTLADDMGYEAFRTSDTCDLSNDDPFVAAMNMKLAAYAGIDPAYGEPMQGQRYQVGQEFKAHTDYFEPDGRDYQKYCGRSGNRSWTMMVYLNEPRAGGATRFTAIDKLIQPETGKLVAWNNRLPDGRCNPATIHHGMKVRAGTKYIITKWFREQVWIG